MRFKVPGRQDWAQWPVILLTGAPNLLGTPLTLRLQVRSEDPVHSLMWVFAIVMHPEERRNLRSFGPI
jgi:hypothetical protein